ncbi:MAG: hypothetical protein P1U46_02500 [Patescibacteria group bacterium]|nr:hypothetical protein [Patescibacteria group bacterium]
MYSYSKLLKNLDSSSGLDGKLCHICNFLFANISSNSDAIFSTSSLTFESFFSHSFVESHVSLGFSDHTYLETLDISVIGTKSLSSFLYSIVMYSFFIHQSSFSTISLKIQTQ